VQTASWCDGCYSKNFHYPSAWRFCCICSFWKLFILSRFVNANNDHCAVKINDLFVFKTRTRMAHVSRAQLKAFIYSTIFFLYTTFFSFYLKCIIFFVFVVLFLITLIFVDSGFSPCNVWIL